MTNQYPSYLEAHSSGRLKAAAAAATNMLKSCTLCPRRCNVDRLAGEQGVCKTAARAVVASYDPHFGEEAPLVGANGSGTVFFSHCNLLCIFCQNYDISHGGVGREVTADQLATAMLHLQELGCHNINFVSPSHVVPQILEAVDIAAGRGLKLPLVYNSGGYDRVQTLKLLAGVFDVYMPDFKFWDPQIAERACNAPDYPEVARRAVLEMHRQVGDLQIDSHGIARRGLILRHLVMPKGSAGTASIMQFIASSVSTDTYVNIMFQYRPCGRAHTTDAFAGSPRQSDFKEAVQAAEDAGLHRLDRPRKVFLLH